MCNHRYRIIDIDFTNEFIGVNLICDECHHNKEVHVKNCYMKEIIDQANDHKNFNIPSDGILGERNEK